MKILIAALAISSAALADHPPREPPPEAYAACTAKAQGDKCTVTHDDHTINGACAGDAKLFCRPDHPHGPPPEALAACSSKKDGEECSVTVRDGSLKSGTCHTTPDEQLACRPAGMPPHEKHGEGAPPPQN